MNEAVTTLILLLRLAESSMKAAQEVSEIMEKAQREGRDLTENEIQRIKHRGDEAVAHWNETSDVESGG